MRILIDIGHPGHVHLFKVFANEMLNKNNEVFFTCREKEYEKELLKAFGFKYSSFGVKYNSILGKIFGLLLFDLKMILVAMKFKPDIFISAGSIYASHASYLLRKTHFSLEDTGNMEQVRLYLPFTEKIFVPESLNQNFGKKEVRYKGLHEIFYLHPDVFKENKKLQMKIKAVFKRELIFIRLISWKASHDKLNHKGGIKQGISKLVDFLIERNYDIIISSEGELPMHLEKYRMNFSPEDLHQVLKCSKLYIGEGGTTATEASLLGTPSILINPQSKYIRSREILRDKYGLLYFFDELDDALPKINELITIKGLKELSMQNLIRFFNDHINCSDFLVNYVSKYKIGNRKK